ncbi:MAG TPA: LuxR C-terminal-related transcriptional regulator [Symbiobacteriaceae bacterium]|nr:LuxR C-terminal-related transcriptional regulator [Symbiobacteriaceae bacterium]
MMGRQLTLISAPAGFGKSTCAAQWAGGLDLPAAWLALDRSDDDPARFYAYLVAALQHVDGTLGREVAGVLNAGQLPPAEIISASLVNDIVAVGIRFLLVLDDLHVIRDRTIQAALSHLIANQPGNMHLALLTREDPPLPLARLRANNQITEIRAADLRFTRDEADVFLGNVMGLSLSPADISALEEKTEGWIAGLQLAGLSMRDRRDPSGFVAGLSGSHRHIMSYLTEEVLSLQPPEVQEFLLQTAVLNRLSGPLCDAVTGRTDGTAMLERLYHTNLFIIPLDDEQCWYRYHHLFADLLRSARNAHGKEQEAELHRRASRWFDQAGMPGEAVRHALDAKDYGLAVQQLERCATGMIVQGYAKTVEEWLDAIPAEMRLRSPRANLAFAWMHLMRGTFVRAEPYLERLHGAFSRAGAETGDLALRAEWLALQSYLLIGQGDAPGGQDLAARALELAPEGDGYVRSLAYNGIAAAYMLSGKFAEAVAVCQKAAWGGRAMGSFGAELLGVSILTQIALRYGQYHLAVEAASQVTARLDAAGSPPPMGSVLYGARGQVCCEWLQVGQARRYLDRAVRLARLGGYPDGEIYGRAVLARLHRAEGDLEAARREVDTAVSLMQSGAPAWVRSEVISEQVCIELARDRLTAAESVLEGRWFDLPIGHNISYEDGLLYNSALRTLLHRARTRHEQAAALCALELSDRLVSRALDARLVPIALRALLIRAQVLAVRGEGEASLAVCRAALELAEPEGFTGSFVHEGAALAEPLGVLINRNQLGQVSPGYVRKILAALPSEAAPRGAPAEALSRRELEILSLLAAGCSNQAMADRLFLSLNTVKKHVSNIFAKLGAANRTQAVARARQAGLLNGESLL